MRESNFKMPKVFLAKYKKENGEEGEASETNTAATFNNEGKSILASSRNGPS